MPKNGLGKAVVLYIVGLSPLIAGIVLDLIIKNELFESLIMSSCSLIGGVLDVFILKKEYGVRLQEKITKKIDMKLIIIVIVLAVGYTITSGSILKHDIFKDVYGQNDYMTIFDWIAVGLFAPIGEELIYRYAIFSSICDDNKKGSIIVAFVISSFLFTITHLDNGILRNTDLFVFAIISAVIFFYSKNLIYNIIFHSVSNITVYSMAYLYQKIMFNNKILFISLPLLIIALTFLIIFFRNINRLKRINIMGC